MKKAPASTDGRREERRLLPALALCLLAVPPLARSETPSSAAPVAHDFERRDDRRRHALDVGGFVQERFAVDGENRQALTIPRIRLFAFGHVGNERLHYRVMVGRNEYDDPIQPQLELFDAWLEYRLAPGARLRTGVFKVPVFREWLESSRQLGSVERSYLTRSMLPGRSPGLLLLGDAADERLEYSFGVFERSQGSDAFQPGLAGRALWKLGGRTIEGELAFADEPTAVAFGVSGLWEPLLGLVGATSSTGVEGALRHRSHALTAEWMGRRTAQGLWLRGGYLRADRCLAPLRTTIGARVSTLRAPNFFRDEAELSIGFLPLRHDLKLVADFGVARVVAHSLERLVRVQLQTGF